DDRTGERAGANRMLVTCESQQPGLFRSHVEQARRCEGVHDGVGRRLRRLRRLQRDEERERGMDCHGSTGNFLCPPLSGVVARPLPPVLLGCPVTALPAQRPSSVAPVGADGDAGANPAPIPNEQSSVTDHTIKMGGQLVPYRATAATMLLKND